MLSDAVAAFLRKQLNRGTRERRRQGDLGKVTPGWLSTAQGSAIVEDESGGGSRIIVGVTFDVTQAEGVRSSFSSSSRS